MPKRGEKRVVDESLLAGTSLFPQLQLVFSDPAQERYEVARPLLRGQPITAKERAQQTQKLPQAVRRGDWFVLEPQQRGSRQAVSFA